MADLRAAKPFQGLNPEELENLRRIAQEQQFAAGEQIFGEGDPGKSVYVIGDGLVEIAHLADLEEDRVFSQLGPGEIFGEMAVIENLPRSATATAAKTARVYCFPRDEMLALLKRSPGLAFNLLQEISRRLRDFNQRHLREIIQAERLAVVGNFARSILHDLKNPLTVIGLAVETLDRPGIAPEKRAQALGYIRKQAWHIQEMIGDILEFTQSVQSASTLVSTNYRQFLQELLPELRVDAEAKSVRIEMQREPPVVVLPLDARRLRRVFFNLLHNAMDAMTGGGQVRLRCQPGDNEIITEMEDTGPGIAAEIADRLFQPFATHGKPHGSGLGLSICKRIIEDHGGRIWAKNAPARGAIFSFALPLGQRAATSKR